MRPEAVVFDLFGTLVGTFSVREHERAVFEMAAVLRAPPDEFERLWGSETWLQRATGFFPTVAANVEYVCQALGLEVEAHRIAAAAEIVSGFTRRALIPRRDAVETLTRLRAAGCRAGLISDCSPEVPVVWPETPFAPLIDVPVFSCAVGLMKPDPRIYRLACKRLEVPPQRCLYVGDGSGRELTGALQVGMRAALIRVPLDDVYDDDRPDVREWRGPAISTLAEVLTLLE